MSASAVSWLVHRGAVAVDAPLLPEPGLTRRTLEVMRSEGLVEHLGATIYLPADAEVAPASRARAFVPLVPRWGVLALQAACWVHGGPRPVPPFVVLADLPVGPRNLPEGMAVTHSSLHPDHVTFTSGLALTSPARTAADLARWGDAEADRESLRWLLARATSVKDVRQVLDGQTRFRHARRARRRLQALRSGHDDSALWRAP